MENASKALIIAGGILLAMIIISLLVYVGISMSDMAESQDRKKNTEQIVEFNRSYEAYNKTRMYGTDVISVVNKANDNNKKYKNDTTYHVIITIINTSGENINMSYEKDFKNSIFKCQKVLYNETTGRINYMEFMQISVD